MTISTKIVTKVINLYGGPGTGKCFGKDTPIMMYDTSVKYVQNVEVGDLVMGPDGTPRTVLDTTSGREELYYVKQNKGLNYVVNESHIMSLRSGGDQKGFYKGQIVNIPVLDYLDLPPSRSVRLKGYKGDLKFLNSESSMPLDPYIFGLWLADGTSAKAEITFNKEDRSLIHEFYDFCEKNSYGTNICPSRDREGCVAIYASGGLCTTLKDMGVRNNKHIPAIYKTASYADRLSLLAGYLDGDGFKDNSCFESCVKQDSLATDLAFIARSVGMYVFLTKTFKRCQGFEGRFYNRLYISGHTDKIPNKLERKKCSPRLIGKSPGATGIDILPLGNGDYFGFSVDIDHLFCLEDLTVVHNSTTTALLFARMKFMGINCELAPEFAKDVVWGDCTALLKDQIYIFGQQHQRLFRLQGKVDYVITDSPLLLSMVYGKSMPSSFRDLVSDTYDNFHNFDIFLNRVKAFNPAGRMQTEEEAIALDVEVKEVLDMFGGGHYDEVVADESAADKIIELLDINADIKK